MTTRLSLLLAAVIGLSACDDNNNTAAKGISSLGGDFVRIFNQDRNDEPEDASQVSVNQSANAEPFNP